MGQHDEVGLTERRDDGVDVELEEREEGAARAPGFAGVLLVQGRIAAALSVASRGLFGAVSAALHGDTGYVEPMFQTMLDGLRPLAGR